MVTKIPWKKRAKLLRRVSRQTCAECRRQKASKISMFHVGKVLKADGRRAKGRRKIHFLALRADWEV